jgi:hypothetical protein
MNKRLKKLEINSSNKKAILLMRIAFLLIQRQNKTP